MALAGIVIVNKAQGISSHTEMRRVQKLFSASKAGHAGTLDPLATGMLPIYFGEATKFLQYALDSDKTYVATGCFGSKTDTADCTGQIIWQHQNPLEPTKAELHEALSHFLGQISQTPPMYSALKHQGKPLYHYARQGREILRQPRTVEIKLLELLNYSWPHFTIRVMCSKGTYIRNLIEDLGDKLFLGAHLTALIRESVLGFNSELMHKYVDLLQMDQSELQEMLLPVDYGIQHFTIINLTNSEIVALQQGKIIRSSQIILADTVYRIYDFNEKFYGLGNSFNDIDSNAVLIKAHRMMSLI